MLMNFFVTKTPTKMGHVTVYLERASVESGVGEMSLDVDVMMNIEFVDKVYL